MIRQFSTGATRDTEMGKPFNCKCKFCGKDFYLKPSALKKGRGKFCCKECQTKSMIKKQDVICSVCGRVFVAKISDIKRGHAGCCSILCRTKKQTGSGNPHWIDGRSKRPKLGTPKGARHWNWRGGKTKTIESVRMMPENKKWRKSVFKRDNYTCQECGKRGGYLQVDHIYPLSFIIDNFKIKSREDARNNTLLWDINNGRTLCLSCHRKTSTFGINLIYFKNGKQTQNTSI